MHHIKPTSKGDPLCPLGFHPQVRWPTRCKRCFRDYKEHGNRNKDNDSQLRRDELTVSTPALSSYSSRSREEPTIPGNTIGTRTWTSSSNLSSTANLGRTENTFSESSSWTSTPNLAEKKDEPVATVSFTLPRRRRPVDEETKNDADDYRRTQYTVRRRTTNVGPGEYREVGRPSLSNSTSVNNSNSSSSSSSSSNSSATPTIQPTAAPVTTVSKPPPHPQPAARQNNSDVDFIFRVKSSSTRSQESPSRSRDVTRPLEKEPPPKARTDDESSSSSSSDEDSLAGTETTETTIVNPHEQQLQEEIDSLKRDLEIMKTRCEKAEREKSDILLRRLATFETTSSKTTASEALKLQQKCNELKTTVEDLRDEKKVLALRVRELEADLEVTKAKSSQKEAEQLRGKLAAAETLCEELMEENEDMKRELRDMEEEMVEMQDNFREDQADEYSSMKKELEQTNKNCRILSFKLRKAERKTEQLEAERQEAERKLREIAGGQSGLDKAERIRQLEHELSVANEAASRLQKELEETNKRLKSTENETEKGTPAKKKAPMLGSLPKTPSGERVSRESLTRGGSQEDPAQLLRDLQDSLEREADLREQLRQAEEEAQSLHKKASRVEDDNESLLLQLKKMATKARTRRLSPTPQRLSEPVDKDEGISDEEDPAELRLQLELNEQEASVIRRKVEELESEGDHLKKKVKDLQDKLAATKTAPPVKKTVLKSTETNAVYEQKMKVLEEEMSELRKKLIEKDRECERLHAEMSIGVKKPKILQKSKSLDADPQTVDLKRQLQVVETEANVLRTRIQNLESENEKLQSENKKLSLVKATKRSSSIERSSEDENNKIAQLEKQLEESKNKIKELEKNNTAPVKKDSTVAVGENEKLKTQLKKAETEKKKLEESIKRMKEDAVSDILTFYQNRTPKIPTDLTTKLQMKRMVDEAEKEIGELLVILKKSENEKKTLAENKGPSEETESLKDELEKTKWKLQLIINQNEEEVGNREKEKEKFFKTITESDEEKNKLRKEVDKYKVQLEKEKQKVQDAKNDLDKQKKTLSEEISTLKDEIKKAKTAKIESMELKAKLDAVNTELLEEKKQKELLNKQLEAASQIDSERDELKTEMEQKSSKIVEMEKRVKELEEKLKKSEKLVALKKEKVIKLEKEKEVVNSKMSNLEKEKNDTLSKQKETGDKLKEAEDKINRLEKELVAKNASIEQMENSMKGEKDSELKKSISEQLAMTQEINKLQEDLNNAQSKLKEMTAQIEQKEQDLKSAEESARTKEKELQTEIEQWEKKASELEMDLQVSSTECASDDVKDQVAALEQQISCLEDELSESRVEAARLRTELVSERSAWEVQISELTSRLNEMEEEKILSSGRVKISGLKTKMELAWQKEREEQHRILQETSTLARDLRQTLFEVERERDKERLEAKRRIDQQKKRAEEEQEEIRKKLNEMQCDLLELRDAHAKLRTTNEKLRREKERWEKEKDMLKQSFMAKKRMDQEDERRIISVAQLVEELTVLAPDLFPSKPKHQPGMPTPPVRRKGSKSRETSPALERKDYSRESSVGREDAKSQEVQEILIRLTEAANQLKKHKRSLDERDAMKKAFSSKRAGSTESDGEFERPKMREGVTKKGGLLRKSLSLEQTSAQEQAIWKIEEDKDGSLPSVQSLDEIDQLPYMYRRDPSLDSRLSGGSTKSEMLPSTDKKKKSSLFGKLKKLTKSSRSVDRNLDGSDLGSTGQLDRGSDTSLSTIDEKGSKSFKLSGMFRKAGSTSRGNSLERNIKPPTNYPTDSTQRPLVNSSAMSNVSNSSDISNSSKTFASVAKKPPSSAPVQRKVKK